MAISPSPFDRIRNPRGRHLGSPLPVVLSVIVLAVLVALVVVFRQPLSGIFWLVVKPVVEFRNSLAATEAAALRAELASTTAVLADRNALYKENIDLKERLGRSGLPPRVLAAVLERPPLTPYDTLLVDAGAAQGVALGDLVSAGGQALIGRISEVQTQVARVELFSAPGASYQATLNAVLPVAVEGQGGGSMQASVPAGSTVAVGDSVHLGGLAGGMAALVSAVDARAGESFIVIYMRLPANPNELQFVEIWKQQ